ncbi:MAG: hypothetical protein LBO80_00370 [Treponema sp.]|jgi:hypothetical protein|nr:hypothetical protein [Treponema sp.]
MKRLTLLWIVLFALCGFPLFGETYGIQSREVSELRYLYRRGARVFPFFSYPVHGSNLLAAAEKLRGGLSGEDAAALDRVIADLAAYDKRAVLIRGGLSAAYQHRFRSGRVLIDKGGVPNGADFRRAFLSFPPVLDLSAGGGGFTGLFLEAEAILRPAWGGGYSPDNNFFFPSSQFDITFDLINKGVLSWNGKYIDAFFGRDANHFGDTPGGSLYPSRDLPYMDGLRFMIALGPFSMDYLLSTIQPKEAPWDVYPNTDGLDAGPGGPGDNGGEHFGFMTSANPSVILSALHRFQWNFGRVKAGAGANVVYVRSNNMYTVTDISPLMSWHNADMRPNNMNLVLDLSWALYPGLTLTGMLGFDDINGDMIGIPDSGTPTIPAGILQLEYGFRGERLRGEFLFEAGYTHYLWGNFAYETDDEWGSAPLARGVYRYSPSKEGVILPLTSPYGPGVIWGRLVSAFTLPRYNLKIGADLLLLTKNEAVNLIDTWYTSDDPTHRSRRIWYLSLDLPCTYTWKRLDFYLSPALLLRNARAAFECTLGFKYTLEGKRFFAEKDEA